MMIFALGLISQVLFFLRTVSQWILSERAQKVISPSVYWVLSIVASYLFFIYGWLRNDFAILLGQSITYYIYIWNLNKNGLWAKLPIAVKLLLLFTPIFAAIVLLKEDNTFIDKFFSNQAIPLWLLVFGSIGQVIFTFRFVYQLIYSIRKNESVLPLGFWLISLTGSVIILVYGMIRLDPILVLGQSLGLIAYVRNVMLHHWEQKGALKKQKTLQ
ncbi:MAG: lipid-A-disaccharide synthase N-terminal domain-containing protein [Prolixibacteraceae bacterium]